MALVVLKVVVSEGQRRGSLFVPIHWSGETASSRRVGDLVAPQTDPVSGQPEAKATPVAIAPVALPARGFARARQPLPLPEETWWARVAVAEGIELRLATNERADGLARSRRPALFGGRALPMPWTAAGSIGPRHFVEGGLRLVSSRRPLGGRCDPVKSPL